VTGGVCVWIGFSAPGAASGGVGAGANSGGEFGHHDRIGCRIIIGLAGGHGRWSFLARGEMTP
jgi:hypothetical protein